MSHPTPLAPIASTRRIESLDVLRGIAVLGILLMNIPLMGLTADWTLPDLPVQANPDWIAFMLQDVLFAGTMRGLFTLLFGAGAIIMLTRADPASETTARHAYYTRCMALILLGLAQFAVFLWPGEILFNYGLVGLALPLFLKAPQRLLVTAAIAALLVVTVSLTASRGFGLLEKQRLAEAATAATAAGREPTEEQKQAHEAMDKMVEKVKAVRSPESRAKEHAERTHYPSVLEWSTKDWHKSNLTGLWTVLLPLESLAFMLTGMFLYRAGVLSARRSTGFYLALALAGLGLGLLVRGGVEVLNWRAGYLPDAASLVPRMLLYETGRLSMTLGLLGLVLLVLRNGLLRRTASTLSAVGRLALTNYIGQSIISSILFYALGWFDRFGFAQLMGICVLIWIAQCIFSVLWLRRFDMGPAESLLRSVTYGTPFSMKKKRLDKTMEPEPA